MKTTSATTAAAAIAAKPTAPPRITPDAITVIAPHQRVVTPCSTVVGLMREACVDEGDVWMGMVTAEPGTASIWHDHGERTTYLLPVSGEGAYLEYEGGERVPLRCDGTVYVTPGGLRHREVNAGTTRMEAFLIRIGPKSHGQSE